jgi:D-methionine transport system substrate-binding protein
MGTDGQDSQGQEEQQGQTEEKKEIKIGTIAVDIPTVEAGIPSMEALGYKVEIVSFDDAIMPNTALMEGSIDANLFQHGKFMEGFNKDKGADLVMLDPPLIFSRYAVYSSKYDDYNDLPDKALVVLSSDPSNKERSLNMLQKMGLITLKDAPTNGLYTLDDIAENPKNLQFKEVLDVQVPTTLEDADMIVVYHPHMVQGGYNTDNPLYIEEDSFHDYGVGLTVDSKNRDTQWAKDLVEAYTSDETKANLEKLAPERGFEVLD